MAAPVRPTWDPKSPWRLEIIFDRDSRSLPIVFDTKEGAVKQIQEWIAQGYVVEDRASEKSKYDSTFHPIESVRSFHIFSREDE